MIAFCLLSPAFALFIAPTPTACSYTSQEDRMGNNGARPGYQIGINYPTRDTKKRAGE